MGRTGRGINRKSLLGCHLHKTSPAAVERLAKKILAASLACLFDLIYH